MGREDQLSITAKKKTIEQLRSIRDKVGASNDDVLKFAIRWYRLTAWFYFLKRNISRLVYKIKRIIGWL